MWLLSLYQHQYQVSAIALDVQAQNVQKILRFLKITLCLMTQES